ncbi:MAG: 5'-deoxynucleotidase [Ruminococcaceae bacterium]|nr:5'-deoxynucleotidase [Oscillospiraceae bacterium]
MKFHFFSMISRMKYINRWGLMRNTKAENLSEHSLETAVIAQALALIGKKRLNKNIDENKVAAVALYHDASEIITGDLPTPIKYNSPEIRDSYKEIELSASKRLLSSLPDDLRGFYSELLLNEDREIERYVKAADKISAIIKCIEEKKSGNREFLSAEKTLREAVKNMNMEEAEIFTEEFLPSFELSLDEQNI